MPEAPIAMWGTALSVFAYVQLIVTCIYATFLLDVLGKSFAQLVLFPRPLI